VGRHQRAVGQFDVGQETLVALNQTAWHQLGVRVQMVHVSGLALAGAEGKPILFDSLTGHGL
jgi:hypothetical protein